MQQLLNNLDSAIKTLIDAAGSGATGFTGHDGDNQVRPSFTVSSDSGEELPVGSGNFKVSVTVAVRSNADDSTLAVHETLCESVFGSVMTGSVGADATALALGVSVYDPAVNRQASQRVEDDCWLSELRFDVYCCLQSLA